MKRKIICIGIVSIFLLMGLMSGSASKLEINQIDAGVNEKITEINTVGDPVYPYYDVLTCLPLEAEFPIDDLTKTPKYIVLKESGAGKWGLFFNINIEGKCDYISVGGDLWGSGKPPLYELKDTNAKLQVKMMFGWLGENDERIRVVAGPDYCWGFGFGVTQYKLRITPL